MTEILPFHRLHPAPAVVAAREYAPGYRPLALATNERDLVTIYLPAGGKVELTLPADQSHSSQWYDPRRGESCPAVPAEAAAGFVAPPGQEGNAHPPDWVLVLRRP